MAVAVSVSLTGGPPRQEHSQAHGLEDSAMLDPGEYHPISPQIQGGNVAGADAALIPVAPMTLICASAAMEVWP